VSDEEILDAVRSLSSKAGIFVEPAAAATLAGLRKSLEINVLTKDEKIVLLLTGHGLKAPEAAIGTMKATLIEPDISEVRKKEPV